MGQYYQVRDCVSFVFGWSLCKGRYDQPHTAEEVQYLLETSLLEYIVLMLCETFVDHQFINFFFIILSLVVHSRDKSQLTVYFCKTRCKERFSYLFYVT